MYRAVFQNAFLQKSIFPMVLKILLVDFSLKDLILKPAIAQMHREIGCFKKSNDFMCVCE